MAEELVMGSRGFEIKSLEESRRELQLAIHHATQSSVDAESITRAIEAFTEAKIKEIKRKDSR